MEKKLVIIPTYNEVENIEKIIAAVSDIEGNYHILVIDDGSPDGTADAVRSIQKHFPHRKKRKARPWHGVCRWIQVGPGA